MAKGEPLTDRQAAALRSLGVLGRAWPGLYWAAYSIGGYSVTHHSSTLVALVRRGLAERKRRPFGKKAWAYRITEAGRSALGAGEHG